MNGLRLTIDHLLLDRPAAGDPAGFGAALAAELDRRLAAAGSAAAEPPSTAEIERRVASAVEAVLAGAPAAPQRPAGPPEGGRRG